VNDGLLSPSSWVKGLNLSDRQSNQIKDEDQDQINCYCLQFEAFTTHTGRGTCHGLKKLDKLDQAPFSY
jgi:hypothetical protein